MMVDVTQRDSPGYSTSFAIPPRFSVFHPRPTGLSVVLPGYSVFSPWHHECSNLIHYPVQNGISLRVSGSSIGFNHEIKKFPDFFAVTVSFLNDSQCLIAFQVSTKIKAVCFQDFTDCFPGKTLPLQPDNVDPFRIGALKTCQIS